MVTGRRLFEGEDVTETLALVIKGEPKWDGIPANVQRLLKSCLEKDPKRRLRDIGDAWRLLEEAPAATVASRSRVGIAGVDRRSGCGRCRRSIGLRKLQGEAALGGSGALPDLLCRPRRTSRSPLHTCRPTAAGRLPVSATRRAALNCGSAPWIPSNPGPWPERKAWSMPVFWSPDSRSLGFVAQGKLKKVDVSGGSPQTVCDFPVVAAEPGQCGTFRSGAWNRDGVILFGTANTGLWRVSAAGGSPHRGHKTRPFAQGTVSCRTRFPSRRPAVPL